MVTKSVSQSDLKISVAMATYNGAQFLPDQLRSLAEQTRVPDELVVCDDNSCDSTVEILEKFSASVSINVLIIRHPERRGHVAAFNTALDSCSGDFVFLSDQDDYWFPDKIAAMEELQSQHPRALLFMNDAAISDGALTDVGLTKLGQIASGGYSLDTFVMGCCCAFRRELLDLCLPIPSDYRGHDNWLVSFAMGVDARYVSKKVLQFYRRHDDNTSGVLVNSVVPISRFERLKLRIARGLASNSRSVSVTEIQQLTILRNGVNASITAANNFRREQLGHFSSQLTVRIEFLGERLAIRDSALPQRFSRALVFLARRDGSNEYGIWKALRDMAG